MINNNTLLLFKFKKFLPILHISFHIKAVVKDSYENLFLRTSTKSSEVRVCFRPFITNSYGFLMRPEYLVVYVIVIRTKK